MSAKQQVITIDDISADNAPAIYVAGGLGQFFDAVKAEVTGEVPDLTTRKGRERIASLAATVSKSKAAVEKPGRDYLRRLKEMPKWWKPSCAISSPRWTTCAIPPASR